MKGDLGDRMTRYEAMEAGCRLLPVLAWIDGRVFHAFSRGMQRPFDAAFTFRLVGTTVELVRETGACMGCTRATKSPWPGENHRKPPMLRLQFVPL